MARSANEVSDDVPVEPKRILRLLTFAAVVVHVPYATTQYVVPIAIVLAGTV
jgi:hypothetical protein